MQLHATDCNSNGLSPQQEHAAELPITGLSVLEVADALGIHRTTLWHWRKLETFQAYSNTLRIEVQTRATDGVGALHQKALATVERMLENANDGVALRAATLVLDKIQQRQLGETDPRRIIRAREVEKSSTVFSDALSMGAAGCSG